MITFNLGFVILLEALYVDKVEPWGVADRPFFSAHYWDGWDLHPGDWVLPDDAAGYIIKKVKNDRACA